MIDVYCDSCGKEIHSRSKIVKGDAIQYNYECECSKVYFITILKGVRAYPVDDVPEPVPRADAIVSLPEKKCAAPETIFDMEADVRRLKLEKEILDLDEYLYHARERERLR